MASFSLSGNIIDIVARRIYSGTITVSDGFISFIKEEPLDPSFPYIMPGFIDSHIHIESSMLIPSEFARLAVVHGTVATVSDPHEIANVLGLDGIEFMLANSRSVPFKFFFGAPSCVPATGFESAGASITPNDIEHLLARDDIYYLSEMMNYPGVLLEFPDVQSKLTSAIRHKKPVDGHAPGLSGSDLVKYTRSGISTDHECFTLEEALEKINLGMKILIREGSAARNFDALHPLLASHPDLLMFCSDDRHPDDLINSHINELVKRSLELGYDLFDVLRASSFNANQHYNLNVGLLQIGDPADFIVVDNLDSLNVIKTFISGNLLADNSISLIQPVNADPVNNFNIEDLNLSDLSIKSKNTHIRVIEAIDGQLVTGEIIEKPKIINNNIISDTDKDILKIAVVNRYQKSPVSIGFIKNFKLSRGALASSIAHDSHNIIAVGVSDEELLEAVNIIIQNKGGISVVDGENTNYLSLPFAGLMSCDDGYKVAEKYHQLNSIARSLGCPFESPFMTLSFMALLVIPKLKLSDKGLFDSTTFDFVDLNVSGSN